MMFEEGCIYAIKSKDHHWKCISLVTEVNMKNQVYYFKDSEGTGSIEPPGGKWNRGFREVDDIEAIYLGNKETHPEYFL